MALVNPLIRNIDGGDLLEIFLISGVTSILGIRLFLKIAQYPQISAGEFHIAHLLFGGFFMLIAFIFVFGYLNKAALQFAAILGGIGFGTFIDELGKFITRDNNYFYQPTVPILYVIFIGLYFVFRYFDKQTKFTKKEYLMNALEMMENVVLQDLDPEEKKVTEKILNKCDPKDSIVVAMKHSLHTSELVAMPESPLRSIQKAMRKFYHSVMKNRWFLRLVVLIFLVKAVITIFQAIQVGITFSLHPTGWMTINTVSFSGLGEIISSGISSAFVVAGAIIIYQSRIKSYKLFQTALLISIFFTQFFTFYREQFSAIIALGINIVLLIAVQYMISQEEI